MGILGLVPCRLKLQCLYRILSMMANVVVVDTIITITTRDHVRGWIKFFSIHILPADSLDPKTSEQDMDRAVDDG